jgi:hypothetical protein
MQLVLLYDGSNIAAQMDANPAAAQTARAAAEALLSTAPRPQKGLTHGYKAT